MTLQDGGVYAFGPFRLDASDRLLRRDGAAVPLDPTQFQVLMVLLGEAGHLVTREHLMGAVWKDIYVDEGSLTVTICNLRKNLGDSPSHSRYIETVRKSGYRFVAPVLRLPESIEPAPSLPPPESSHATAREAPAARPLQSILLAALIAATAISAWYWSLSPSAGRLVSAPVPLFPFGGMQDDPSFSPDGTHVAFSWRAPESSNDDIYVLKIGELNAIRLTNHPAVDKSPAWSPDGRRIAFIRREGSRGEVLLISPAGGPEQKIAETQGTLLAWGADSQALAFIDRAPGEEVTSIFLVSAAGGPKRQVTFPAVEQAWGDSWPAISPDGRMLAFVRQLTFDIADVFVQPLDATAARRLTFDKRQIRGLAWAPDGRELIFSSNRSGRFQLWRVAQGGAAPTLVEGIADARSLAVSRARGGSGSRLVYQSFIEDFNIRMLQRDSAATWSVSKTAVHAGSIRDEHSPRLSPDGRRLAFVSDRSGWFELWVCAYSESPDCHQLTTFRQGYVGSPSWSPDGERIAFDARIDGNADIYLVRAAGGEPVRLTTEVAVESLPTWSRDGASIYFRSDRSGSQQIWKMPVTGGTPRQVTRNGGWVAHESIDGTSVYYVRGRYAQGLWTVPVDGGLETRVPGLTSLTASNWAITDRGILWIDVTVANPPAPIRAFDWATGEVSQIAEVPRAVTPSATGFSATRDGSILMWSQLDRSAHDLMLVERFR